MRSCLSADPSSPLRAVAQTTRYRSSAALRTGPRGPLAVRRPGSGRRQRGSCPARRLPGDPRCRPTPGARLVARGWHAARGPIRLLTHLRYFGWVMNPVSSFTTLRRRRYAGRDRGRRDHQHASGTSAIAYVLRTADARAVGAQNLRSGNSTSASTSRRSCRWTCATTGGSPSPGERCTNHMENLAQTAPAVRRDARCAAREPITTRVLARHASARRSPAGHAGYPLMSSLIHWRRCASG